MSAEKEIERLEREINAKAAENSGQGKSAPPPGPRGSSPSAPGGNNPPSRSGGCTTPLALVGILIAVAVLLPAAGRLSRDQFRSLSAGAAGAAVGVAVGYGLGRRKG